MTEDELLSNVLELAKFAGWRVCHFRPARTVKGWRTAMQGDLGFPDVALVGHGKFLLAELKSSKGNTSPDQDCWLKALTVAGVECHIWFPDDWLDGTIAKILGCEGGVIP